MHRFHTNVGVGLTDICRSDDAASAQRHDRDTAYLLASGAFNGTGIAVASQSFGTGGYGLLNVYFQHFTGSIRKLQLMDDGSWQGGDSSNIVATDARNATPISAVAYAMDNRASV